MEPRNAGTKHTPIQTHHNTVGPCVARGPGGSSGIWELAAAEQCGHSGWAGDVELARPRATEKVVWPGDRQWSRQGLGGRDF